MEWRLCGQDPNEEGARSGRHTHQTRLRCFLTSVHVDMNNSRRSKSTTSGVSHRSGSPFPSMCVPTITSCVCAATHLLRLCGAGRRGRQRRPHATTSLAGSRRPSPHSSPRSLLSQRPRLRMCPRTADVRLSARRCPRERQLRQRQRRRRPRSLPPHRLRRVARRTRLRTARCCWPASRS